MSVYFARSKKNGLVKIGCSGSVSDRLVALKIKHGELELLRSVRGSYATEQWYHHRFRRRRQHGEWFVFCGSMLIVKCPLREKNKKRRRQDFVKCHFVISQRRFDLLFDEAKRERRTLSAQLERIIDDARPVLKSA